MIRKDKYMEKLIRFFLTKTRLNYTAFIFLVILGAVTYHTMPKEAFPHIQLDEIRISGSYSGASIDNLNKMAVTKIEKDVKALSGVTKVESYLKSGEFSMILTLDSKADQFTVLNKVKDVITNNRGDLPSDMDEPQAVIPERDEALISVALSSKTKTHDELIELAENLKTDFSAIEDVSKVELLESSTRVYEIIFDNRTIESYGLNKESLSNQIKKLSYIFPLGKIEDDNEHLFLSSRNGAKSAQELLNTMIKIDGKSLYISDIARVKRTYKQSDILSFLDGGRTVKLDISKSEHSNAIVVSKKVNAEIEKQNNLYDDVTFTPYEDSAIEISTRLNTVVSSIMFGLLLVSISIYILINKRVAFIVVLGIPIAILMGTIVFSFTPYTINNITLIGALLILGVLVDDAVIIAENIQRHIANGEDKLQSAIDGTKEVLTPVLASALTTVFAFLPMLILSGRMGEFLKLIPIAAIVLIIASIIESFVFLPLHGLHVLKQEDKELDWSRVNERYKRCLKIYFKIQKDFCIYFRYDDYVFYCIADSQYAISAFPRLR